MALSADTSVNPLVNILPSRASPPVSSQSSAAKAELKALLLDSFQQPLLLNDAKTAILCANKLIANTESESSMTALKEMGEN
jgi:hypothetical protein